MLNLCLQQHRKMLNCPGNTWHIETILNQNPAGLSHRSDSSGKLLLGCKYLMCGKITAWLRIAHEIKVSDFTPSWCFKLAFVFSLSFGHPLWFSKYLYIILQSQTIICLFIVFEKHCGFKPTGHICEQPAIWSFQYPYLLRNCLFCSYKWTHSVTLILR